MGDMDDAARVEAYRKAYGCPMGPRCWCSSPEAIAEGDERMRRQAEEAASVQEAGRVL